MNSRELVLLHLEAVSYELVGVWTCREGRLASHYPAGEESDIAMRGDEIIRGRVDEPVADQTWVLLCDRLATTGGYMDNWRRALLPVGLPTDGIYDYLHSLHPEDTSTAFTGDPEQPDLTGPVPAPRFRDPSMPDTRSPARKAADARAGFVTEAADLAAALLGNTAEQFRPGPRLTSLATWWTDTTGQRLVAVVADSQPEPVMDEVLAYALAWQQDRDQMIVVAPEIAQHTAARLAWLQTPVRLYTHSRTGLTAIPVPPRDATIDAAKNLVRVWEPHDVPGERSAWLEPLLDHPDFRALDLELHQQAGYWTWQHYGLALLRVVNGGRHLTLTAGVDYTHRPTARSYRLTAPLTDADVDQILSAIRVGMRERTDPAAMADYREHRLQAAIHRSTTPIIPGVIDVRREVPAYRAAGREGFIDFLGIDAAGALHVIETKIGHDPRVILQALDYFIWVQAQQAVLRTRYRWPEATDHAPAVVIDLVLGGHSKRPAINAYLAGQLEALAGDIRWRLYTVTGLDTIPPTPQLTEHMLDQLWTTGDDRAEPVTGPRWASRVGATLDPNRRPPR